MTIEIVDLSHHWLFDATLSIIVTIIDNEVIFGACLGSWVATGTRRDMKAWKQLGSFLLSACVGVIHAPLLHAEGFHACGGHGIHREQCAALPDQFGYFRDGVQDSGAGFSVNHGDHLHVTVSQNP